MHGDLSPLADIRRDVAFRMHSKFRRHHKGARFRANKTTPSPETKNVGVLKMPDAATVEDIARTPQDARYA